MMKGFLLFGYGFHGLPPIYLNIFVVKLVMQHITPQSIRTQSSVKIMIEDFFNQTISVLLP